MLATIASYWFVTLPAVVTGLLMLKWFRQARESKRSEERIRATVRKR